jgi:hypothetical protein
MNEQMNDMVYGVGELTTYLLRKRNWIVGSGIKDGHIFYRRASLACGGRSWHRLEFEYPIEDKKYMDDLVTRFSRQLDVYNSAGCRSK